MARRNYEVAILVQGGETRVYHVQANSRKAASQRAEAQHAQEHPGEEVERVGPATFAGAS